MLSRFENGWAVAMASWGVLRRNKSLVVFPIFSALACLATCALFLLPLAQSGHLPSRGHLFDQGYGPVAVLYVVFVANNFVMIFFNSALVACALVQFAGEKATAAEGLAAAWQRLPQIVAWALFAGTIGWLLRLLEERVRFLSGIVVAILGAAWSVATFFVVPVLVVERLGPVDALRRSIAVMRQQWGEVVGGNLGLGAVSLGLQLPGLALLFLAFMGQVEKPVRIALGALGVIEIIAVVTVIATLSGIFVAALYRYAATGEVTAGFDRDILDAPFHRPA